MVASNKKSIVRHINCIFQYNSRETIFDYVYDINDYVDKKSYIDFDVITQEEALNFIKKIKLISESKPIYDKIINERKKYLSYVSFFYHF